MITDDEKPLSVADIKRSLFQRGLTDHQLLKPAVPEKKPSVVEKRRSRSFGDIIDFEREQPKGIQRNASFRIQKPVSLQQQKKDLLVEIKARLEKRVNHHEKSTTQADQAEEGISEKCEGANGKEATGVTSPEIRKRYSPVYTRTRSICRSSDTSSLYSNSWRNSAKEEMQEVPEKSTEQVVVEEPKEESNHVVKRDSTNPARKSVKSLYSPSDFPHLAGFQFDVLKRNSSVPKLTSPHRNTYSAHPSLYFIEIDAGSDTSDVGKSSSNVKIKRHTSLRQTIKKKLQKTFSQHSVPSTLQNVPKAPGTNIPRFVVSCVETLTKKELIGTEGIYRSSPSQMEIRRVVKQTQKGNFDILEELNEPALLAGLLKNFFFSLKEHLISEETFERHFPIYLSDRLIEEEYLDRLKVLILDLDDIAYDTLAYLMRHLRDVADLSEKNLMKESNLGVVFSPCLFTNCEKKSSTIDLLNCMGLQAKVTELMIVNYDELFGDETPRSAPETPISAIDIPAASSRGTPERTDGEAGQKRRENMNVKKARRARSKTTCVLS
ncbi:rho GTPase-activating protein 21-like [Lutzomyia longipalpis]|uniref:rho GTPase-activating protein 21-like n=1 Tax=Lutzomyia longipalpis TaxID=7200 RepID=UPI0024847265|nr:rho GTPase-activating protein 21-like [Lutzomyia longipalpis]XP_055695210.1 rho GTPase-activating protein 21-like [Lutzomyia longipalpis]XP_055695211.1 rho GTPase-activating protein 21-like [Lutzomyia longipalpis]